MIGPKWIPFKVDPSETSAYIPMDRWGKDHWSTLAYFETLVVDHKGMISNARMRCNARLHRNFAWMTPFSPHTAESEYPTRLKGGIEQPGHDDWSCLEDMIAAGLVNGYFRQLSEATFGNSQAYVELTAAGRALANELRAHKSSGGTYATFVSKAEAAQ
jgi:hypothetical protein